MQDSQKKGIITLIRSAIDGNAHFLPSDFDFNGIASFAQKRQISGLIYYGALNCGISNNLPEMQRLFTLTCQGIAQGTRQMFEIERICNAFEENKICFMPLKGAVLKPLYPKSEMRLMGDADILIRPEQYPEIKKIMTELGYKEAQETDCERVWNYPALHVELHVRLFSSQNKDLYACFGDGWRLAKKVNGNDYRYGMADSDLFLYLFAHFVKHYRDAGIGIKHLVDLWVCVRALELDEEYLKTELEKLRLYRFYLNIRKVTDVWFNGKQADEMTEFITDVIFDSGTFGKKETRLVSSALKDETVSNFKFKRVIRSVFPDYSVMCSLYGFLKRLPFLLPIMWIYRAFYVLFRKGEKISEFNKDIKLLNSDTLDDYRNSLMYVGLDFDFNESDHIREISK